MDETCSVSGARVTAESNKYRVAALPTVGEPLHCTAPHRRLPCPARFCCSPSPCFETRNRVAVAYSLLTLVAYSLSAARGPGTSVHDPDPLRTSCRTQPRGTLWKEVIGHWLYVGRRYHQPHITVAVPGLRSAEQETTVRCC